MTSTQRAQTAGRLVRILQHDPELLTALIERLSRSKRNQQWLQKLVRQAQDIESFQQSLPLPTHRPTIGLRGIGI